MQNDQQTSLSRSQARAYSQQYQQLQKNLASESKIKNICIVVIIAIIFTNFMQARNLKANYEDLQDLVEEVVKSVRDNKHNIQKEQEQRIATIAEVNNSLQKKIVSMEEKMQSLEKTLATESSRLGTKLTKYQETMNKMRKDIEKQQGSTKSVGAGDTLSQTTKQQQATISFVFEQLKEEHHESKTKWLRSMLAHETLKDEKAKTAFMTAFSNIKLLHENVLSQKQSNQLDESISQRLQQEYNLNDYPTELPFCIVVPTYNNAKDFRYQYNLQSILNLKYSNYKVVIIDDASSDGTHQLLASFIASLHTDITIHLLRNEMKLTAVPNINRAIREYCEEGDIAVLVDGDDELLVKDSLRVFSAVYQQRQVDVVYSNHLKLYWHENDVYKGWSAAYSAEEMRDNAYRDVPQKISHLRSFKVSLFLEVKEEDMKDQHGSWFGSTYDEVLLLPVLEMSCGRIAYLEEYFYLYNFGIGSNDLMVDGKKQKDIADFVRRSKLKYQCLNRK